MCCRKRWTTSWNRWTMLTMEVGPPRWTGFSTRFANMHLTSSSNSNRILLFQHGGFITQPEETTCSTPSKAKFSPPHFEALSSSFFCVFFFNTSLIFSFFFFVYACLPARSWQYPYTIHLLCLGLNRSIFFPLDPVENNQTRMMLLSLPSFYFPSNNHVTSSPSLCCSLNKTTAQKKPRLPRYCRRYEVGFICSPCSRVSAALLLDEKKKGTRSCLSRSDSVCVAFITSSIVCEKMTFTEDLASAFSYSLKAEDIFFIYLFFILSCSVSHSLTTSALHLQEHWRCVLRLWLMMPFCPKQHLKKILEKQTDLLWLFTLFMYLLYFCLNENKALNSESIIYVNMCRFFLCVYVKMLGVLCYLQLLPTTMSETAASQCSDKSLTRAADAFIFAHHFIGNRFNLALVVAKLVLLGLTARSRLFVEANENDWNCQFCTFCAVGPIIKPLAVPFKGRLRHRGMLSSKQNASTFAALQTIRIYNQWLKQIKVS